MECIVTSAQMKATLLQVIHRNPRFILSIYQYFIVSFMNNPSYQYSNSKQDRRETQWNACHFTSVDRYTMSFTRLWNKRHSCKTSRKVSCFIHSSIFHRFINEHSSQVLQLQYTIKHHEKH